MPKTMVDMHRVARQGKVEEVAACLEDVGVDDYDGVSNLTALHTACEYNKLEVAKLLLSRKADPNIISMISSPPLVHAAKHGNVELVQALLDGGANPKIRKSLIAAQSGDAGTFPKDLAANPECRAAIEAAEEKWEQKDTAVAG